MVKITICTMVKNEDDIVRKWIEYYGNIFGYGNLYIIDNYSTDKTYEICEEYVKKGIHLLREPDYELKGIYMTHYKNHTHCDIFIPVDIDEFICYYNKNTNLVSKDKDKILNYLESLFNGKKGIFKMNYLNPINTNNADNLDKFTHGIVVDYKDMAKTFIINKNVDKNLTFDHGNHYKTNSYILSDLLLIHFHSRSHEQDLKKTIANVSGFGYSQNLENLRNLSRRKCKGWHHVDKLISVLENPRFTLGPKLNSNISNRWVFIKGIIDTVSS